MRFSLVASGVITEISPVASGVATEISRVASGVATDIFSSCNWGCKSDLLEWGSKCDFVRLQMGL